MTLATILVLLFLHPGSPGYTAQDQSAPAPETQATPAQNGKPSANPPVPAKATPGHPAHPKKAKTTDCATSSPSANSSAAKSGSANTTAGAKKPCSPQKVIVKDGGSDEPIVQLKNDTPPAKASNELLSTEQLRLVTEDNLKKIADRQLTAKQQETVNQIKQFMDQSKDAVADGDLERGHNLAMKARLLSDELLNP
jgi:hypothetical protein